MRTLIIISFLVLLTNCVQDNNDNGNINQDFYSKTLAKVYSPDKRFFATIVEHGLDTTVANTQIIITFDKTGAGIYTVKGIHKDLKVIWLDNATITIETKKEYNSLQKLTQVQSFDDNIKINYADK